VRTLELLERGKRRFSLVEQQPKARTQQLIGDRIEPLRALRVASTHIVQTAFGVAVKGCRHARSRRVLR
jgi:hypothetical protein